MEHTLGSPDARSSRASQRLPDLKEALNDIDVLLGFKAYLDKQFCTENLYFWMEIEVYQKTKDQKALQGRANEIYHKYFSQDSGFELNLPSPIIDDIAKEMEKQAATPHTFEKAQRVVFTMMEQDGWFRWAQSDSFKTFMEGLKEKRRRAQEAKIARSSLSEEESKHEFFIKLFSSMQGGRRKKLFSSGSTVHLQELIKKNTNSIEGGQVDTTTQRNSRSPSPESAAKRKDPVSLSTDTSKSSSQNSKEAESVSEDEVEIAEGGLLQAGILANLLIPIHATLGPISKMSNAPKEDDIISRERNPAAARDFHNLFKLEEKLIEHYTCAYKGGKGIINQGRMYISARHVCFYSTFLGKVTEKILTWDHIVSVEKANTAKVIPNAIEMRTVHGKKILFQNFVNRDQCFDTLESELKKARVKKNGLDPKKPLSKRSSIDFL